MKKLTLILTILLFFTSLNFVWAKDLDLYLYDDSYQSHHLNNAFISSFKKVDDVENEFENDNADYYFHSMYFKLFNSYDAKEISDYKIDEYDVQIQSKIKSLLVDDEVLLDDNLKGNSHYDFEADIILNVNNHIMPYVVYRFADIAFDVASKQLSLNNDNFGVAGVGTKFNLSDNFSLDISYGQDNLHIIENGNDGIIQDHNFNIKTKFIIW